MDSEVGSVGIVPLVDMEIVEAHREAQMRTDNGAKSFRVLFGYGWISSVSEDTRYRR